MRERGECQVPYRAYFSRDLNFANDSKKSRATRIVQVLFAFLIFANGGKIREI